MTSRLLPIASMELFIQPVDETTQVHSIQLNTLKTWILGPDTDGGGIGGLK